MKRLILITLFFIILVFLNFSFNNGKYILGINERETNNLKLKSELLKRISLSDLNKILPDSGQLSYSINNYALDNSGNSFFYLSDNNIIYKINIVLKKIEKQIDLSSKAAKTSFKGLASTKEGVVVYFYNIQESSFINIFEYDSNLKILLGLKFQKPDGEYMNFKYYKQDTQNSIVIGDYINKLIYILRANNNSIKNDVIVDFAGSNEYLYSKIQDTIRIMNTETGRFYRFKTSQHFHYFYNFIFIPNNELFYVERKNTNGIIGIVDFLGNKIDTLYRGEVFHNAESINIRPFKLGFYWETNDSLFIFMPSSACSINSSACARL